MRHKQLGQIKKIGVVQATRPSLIFYPYPKLFYSNFEVEKISEKNVSKCSYNWKTKLLCIHSLVLALEGHIYSSFNLLNAFQNRSIHSKKKKVFQKKKLPIYLPYFFRYVTWTTHVFLFGLKYSIFNLRQLILLTFTYAQKYPFITYVIF